jgi:hypothetical protein
VRNCFSLLDHSHRVSPYFAGATACGLIAKDSDHAPIFDDDPTCLRCNAADADRNSASTRTSRLSPSAIAIALIEHVIPTGHGTAAQQLLNVDCKKFTDVTNRLFGHPLRGKVRDVMVGEGTMFVRYSWLNSDDLAPATEDRVILSFAEGRVRKAEPLNDSLCLWRQLGLVEINN